MKTLPRAAALAGLAGLTAFAAACGTTSARLTTASPDQVKPLSLATSVTTSADIWGVLVAGGKASGHENFWQLLVRPGGTAGWKLVTPPGVASNGGLLIAPLKGHALEAAFRPSQDLKFTPLASTVNAGYSWSSGLINADVASEPSALAGDQATGDLLALLADGSVEQGSASGHWKVIGTRSSLNRAIGHCGMSRLTGVAVTVNGTSLAGGDCTKPGVAGIFAYEGGAWLRSGPSMPKELRRDEISVLALTPSLALLQAGSGARASVLVAADSSNGWTVSGQARLDGASVSSFATGANGAIGLVLTGRRGLLLASPSGSWQTLTGLPERTQTLALGPGKDLQALAPDRTIVSFYDYQPSSGTWTATGKLKIPVQFGSSS